MNKKISLKNFRFKKTTRQILEGVSFHDVMAETAEDALNKLTESSTKAYYNNGTRNGEWFVADGSRSDKTVSYEEDFELIEE